MQGSVPSVAQGGNQSKCPKQPQMHTILSVRSLEKGDVRAAIHFLRMRKMWRGVGAHTAYTKGPLSCPGRCALVCPLFRRVR